MLHKFGMIVPALGLLSVYLVHRFLTDVAHYTRRALKKSWQVAHELLLIYFTAVETDPTRSLTLATVFNRGNQDTYLCQACTNAEAFFRPGGGTPRPGEGGLNPGGGLGEISPKVAKVWDEKTSNPRGKVCVAWNLGRAHKAAALDDACACIYKHKCMQWVSDKGPGGMCLGDHRKIDCTYDADKKLSAALK